MEVKKRPSDYIERGWCQGTPCTDDSGNPVPFYIPGAPHHCLLAAISRAVLDRGITDSQEKQIQAAMRSILNLPPKNHTGDLITWNNAPSRTKEEVLKILYQAEELVLDGMA